MIHTGGSKFRVEDLYDPELNVRYGAWYLRHLLEKYGDEQDALAAYNARADVLYAEPDYEVHALLTPNDPQFPNQWGMQKVAAQTLFRE